MPRYDRHPRLVSCGSMELHDGTPVGYDGTSKVEQAGEVGSLIVASEQNGEPRRTESRLAATARSFSRRVRDANVFCMVERIGVGALTPRSAQCTTRNNVGKKERGS